MRVRLKGQEFKSAIESAVESARIHDAAAIDHLQFVLGEANTKIDQLNKQLEEEIQITQRSAAEFDRRLAIKQREITDLSKLVADRDRDLAILKHDLDVVCDRLSASMWALVEALHQKNRADMKLEGVL